MTIERLHNGIELSINQPLIPVDYDSDEPLPVPWLDAPPTCIDIDTGRQLFIDDFLIERTNLTRRFHAAKTHPASPVLTPTTEVEMNDGHCPVAAPFNDGCWWDPRDRCYKMWYHAGWFDGIALALSDDGLNWHRPELNIVPGTNLVLPRCKGRMRDGAVVWLDDDAPDDQRYKLFIFFRLPNSHHGECYQSADGIHWGEPIRTSEGLGDNSGFFRDSFRDRWVFSLRDGWPRARARHEGRTLFEAARWQQVTPWARVDRLDLPEPSIGIKPELYDLEVVAYESLLLGAFCIFYGPQNPQCAETGTVKTIDMQLGYSRDGYHWHRPHRAPFIASSREPGTWNLGYIHAVGGLCAVHADELWFYYTAFSGQSPKLAPGETGEHDADNAMYAGGGCGLATLRRDGFASMEADDSKGELLTRPLRFSGCHLFVNCDCLDGLLEVAVCDEAGKPIIGFEQSEPLHVNRCKQRVTFKGDLATLAGRPIRLRFRLRRGSLYAFWISSDEGGASNGWLGAGGPDYQSQRDLP